MSAGAAPTLEPFQRSVDVPCGIGQHAGFPHSSRETTAGRVRLECGREALALARQSVSRETPSTHQSAIDDQRLVIDER